MCVCVCVESKRERERERERESWCGFVLLLQDKIYDFSLKCLTVVSASARCSLKCSSLHFSRKEANIFFFFSSPLVRCTLSIRLHMSWKGTSAATSLGGWSLPPAPLLGPGVAMAELGREREGGEERVRETLRERERERERDSVEPTIVCFMHSVLGGTRKQESLHGNY